MSFTPNFMWACRIDFNPHLTRDPWCWKGTSFEALDVSKVGRQLEASVEQQDAHVDYVCGAGASLVNIVHSHYSQSRDNVPQQLEGIRVHKAAGHLRKEGLRTFWADNEVLCTASHAAFTVRVYHVWHVLHVFRHSRVRLTMIYSLPVQDRDSTEGGSHKKCRLHWLLSWVPFERVQCLWLSNSTTLELHNTKHAFQHLLGRNYGPAACCTVVCLLFFLEAWA